MLHYLPLQAHKIYVVLSTTIELSVEKTDIDEGGGGGKRATGKGGREADTRRKTWVKCSVIVHPDKKVKPYIRTVFSGKDSLPTFLRFVLGREREPFSSWLCFKGRSVSVNND